MTLYAPVLAAVARYLFPLLGLGAVLCRKGQKYLLWLILLYALLGYALWGKAVLWSFGAIAGSWWLFSHRGIRPWEQTALFLSLLGMWAICALRPDGLLKQTVALILGIVLYFALCWAQREERRLEKLRPVAAVAGLSLLALTLLFGNTYHGAKNWLSVGVFSIQPGELAKVCFLLLATGKKGRDTDPRALLLYGGACCVCLVMMKDLGGAVVFFAALLALLPGKWAALAAGAAAVFAGALLPQFPHVLSRFQSWGHIWDDPYGKGYQQTRAVASLASGGLLGLGAGKPSMANVFAADTDLVMATVGEQWGLFAVSLAALSILRLTRYVKSPASAAAVTVLLTQSALNLLGTVDILPLTGVTFPFLSNGGSSMVACWGMAAFLEGEKAPERNMRRPIVCALAFCFLLGWGTFLTAYVQVGERWVYEVKSPRAVITDRKGNVLSADDPLTRMATTHLLGRDSPAIYHYRPYLQPHSLLRGSYTYRERTLRATLHRELQTAALGALEGKAGTVAICNYRTGELLCAVSSPAFDPKDTQTETEGMYLNRFTQGLYTPGSVFKVFVLAAALEEWPEAEERQFFCAGEVTLSGEKVSCPHAHGEQTLQEAFRNSCNCAFARIATELGAEKLDRYAERFGLTEIVSFDGIHTARNRISFGEGSLPWAGAGQSQLLINPCNYLTFLTAVAGGGQGVRPCLVKEIRDGYRRLYTATPQKAERILSRESAERLTKYLRSNVKEKYGDVPFLCAKTGTAETGRETPNALLVGFLQEKTAPYAFFICIEEGGSGANCLPIIEKLLSLL